MMGISTLIPPILSRSTSDGGVRLKIKLICGWMMCIRTLIAKELKIYPWIIILTTSNCYISLDQAFNGLKAPCEQSY